MTTHTTIKRLSQVKVGDVIADRHGILFTVEIIWKFRIPHPPQGRSKTHYDLNGTSKGGQPTGLVLPAIIGTGPNRITKVGTYAGND